MSAEELAPGRWDMESSDKFDDYMKAIGVGMATRMIANKLKPSIDFSIVDGLWTMKSLSTFKNSEIQFRLGQEFDETTPDGRSVKTTVTAEGNKLIQSQSGDPPSTLVREFGADKFTLTLSAKDVVCTRVYKKAA